MKLKVILSGGGTGGHIFPAIAIANEIKNRHPDAEFLFIGAKGRMEMEKVPNAGYAIEGLWISGLQRKFTFSNLMFPVKVLSSVLKAKKIIKKFNPNIVIGTGGYASGPTLWAAAKASIPTLIQEQNSFPGITNRLLSKHINTICVAYEGMEKYFPKEKIVLTGNPVRADIVDLSGKRTAAFDFFKLNPAKKTVLVIGGSLGARTINDGVKRLLFDWAKDDVQVIWQTGKTYFSQTDVLAKQYYDKGVRIFEFIKQMDLAYAAADVVVSRAGAISLSELAVAGKACILIPSPNVAEDHQTKNAMALVQKKAAVLVRDADVKLYLQSEIKKMFENQSLRLEFEKNISQLAFPKAATVIANYAIQLANKK